MDGVLLKFLTIKCAKQLSLLQYYSLKQIPVNQTDGDFESH